MEDGSIRHFPFQHELELYQGDTPNILDLLSCLNQDAIACPMFCSLIISGELFHPVGLVASEDYEFLCSVDVLDKLGFVCVFIAACDVHAPDVFVLADLI